MNSNSREADNQVTIKHRAASLMSGRSRSREKHDPWREEEEEEEGEEGGGYRTGNEQEKGLFSPGCLGTCSGKK